MTTSFYQNLKLTIISIVNLTKDAIHMHVGLAVFFLTILVWKHGRFKISGLAPVVIVALSMEAIDLFDNFRHLGYMRWTAGLHDFLNTILWPVLITTGAILMKKDRNGRKSHGQAGGKRH